MVVLGSHKLCFNLDLCSWVSFVHALWNVVSSRLFAMWSTSFFFFLISPFFTVSISFDFFLLLLLLFSI